MKDIKFIYFDAGGVFIDWRKGWEKIIDQLNLPQKAVFNTYSKFSEKLHKGKMDFNEMFQVVADKNNIKLDSSFDPLKEVSKNYGLINETHSFVNEIKNDFKIGLLTNATKKMLNHSIEFGSVPNISWDVVIDSSEVGMEKPDKEIYELAQERSGVNPSEILFIDDMRENIVAAEFCGWNTIHFDFLNPKKSIKEIKKVLNVL